MKELTEDNYNYLTPNFEGIIVSIPTSIGYNADLYVYGNKINTDNKVEISCMAYNMEDGAINGFSYFGNTDFQSIFRDFKYMKHYQFENLNEFCNWYLHKDDKIKESIDKFVKEVKDSPLKSVELSDYLKEQLEDEANPVLAYYKYGDGSENNLYSPDEIRNKINPGWNTRREKLKDVLKLLELRDIRQNTIDMLAENITPEKRCYLEKQLERDEKRLRDFLSEEV